MRLASCVWFLSLFGVRNRYIVSNEKGEVPTGMTWDEPGVVVSETGAGVKAGAGAGAKAYEAEKAKVKAAEAAAATVAKKDGKKRGVFGKLFGRKSKGATKEVVEDAFAEIVLPSKGSGAAGKRRSASVERGGGGSGVGGGRRAAPALAKGDKKPRSKSVERGAASGPLSEDTRASGDKTVSRAELMYLQGLAKQKRLHAQVIPGNTYIDFNKI